MTPRSSNEEGFERRFYGYPALAAWMAQDPENESLIFRRFNGLAARTLLHLQAQLIALESEITQQDDAAYHSREEKAHQASRNWEVLVECGSDSNRQEIKRLERLKESKEVLKEYYEIITLHSQVVEKGKPSHQALVAIREFVKGTARLDKDGYPSAVIAGEATNFLDDETDLLSLARPIEDNVLSRPLRTYWPFGKRSQVNVYDRTMIYKNSRIVQTVAALSLLLAAMLFIGAIVNLYFVQSPVAKLGLVAMYTIFFASSVALCTNAKRVEVFAATAAYAAVLVVFVSGDLGGSKRGGDLNGA
ncbi:hypothetical protein T440DRAFT_464591 [Plenodomus tracheiphilus IPT5]|uniref:DUF6594 domain-containing protein n=1 Tax=Plenodomus tracheiphilus IPT5 TaxID=1408161 RepID=A0A6A7BJ49_9PLEO|nr:hypothetical protein T440DRAFT_464591 [Plenodomus tracheiphilus IPT5]